jgi:hypothetical protein
MAGARQRLISLQNIETELTAHELAAWRWRPRRHPILEREMQKLIEAAAYVIRERSAIDKSPLAI